MSIAIPAEPTYVVSMPDGGQLLIPADLSLMTPYVLQEQGDWFESEIRFIRRWLRPGMQVIDIGANYGVYTCAAAQAVGPLGKVWAFEPARLPHSFLARSISINGWSHVTLLKIALSDRQGTARLGIHANAELNSLSRSDGDGEEVQLSTLDAQRSMLTGKIDFLKLDAEGEEIRILSNARGMLSEHDPLIMFEYNHGVQVNSGLIDALRATGMDVYRLVPGIGALARLEEHKDPDEFLLNLFGCRPSRAEQLTKQGFLINPDHATAAPLQLAEAEKLVGKWAAARPWADSVWPDGLPRRQVKGHEAYMCGLAELILAETCESSVSERFRRLNAAISNLKMAFDQRDSIARGLSLARAQAHAGARTESLRTLRRIETIFIERKRSLGYRPDEVFMPADGRHDGLSAASADPGLLIQAMADEPLLERSAFSVYFLQQGIIPLLRRIKANPLTTPSTKIRVELASKHFGL